MTEVKQTPLHARHKALGGKMVKFAGWELPIMYTGIVEEHRCVRERAGLFDVSHMGEIIVDGVEASKAIDRMTCNAVAGLTDGRAHYSAILNERGGVVDDVIVYRLSKERFLICVNASNTDRAFEWFSKHNRHGATFENRSCDYGQIALQGPLAPLIVRKLRGGKEVAALPYFGFRETRLAGIPLIAARTGYTGEDGFEFFVPWSETGQLWDILLKEGGSDGILPAGLGARDTLRLEACYPLHGHELSEEISALQSGLGWIVKFTKGDFIGKDALLKEKEEGVPRSLVGFVVEDSGIARQNDRVYDYGGREIGIVTSGTKTPTINRAIGMALIDSREAGINQGISITVREKSLRARIVKKPFYNKTVG